jgi:radical SAM protein with 4Fe4S-binding SPASM domain
MGDELRILGPYFRLSADCFLVEGAHDAAIYDVFGGRLFLLDAESHRLLRQCEENVPLDREYLPTRTVEFLQWMQIEGLGFSEETPAFVDRFITRSPLTFRGIAQGPPDFLQLDVSVSNECQNDCPFCPAMKEDKQWQTCITCLRSPKTGRASAQLDDGARLVDRAAELGFRRIHLRGGDPLREWDWVQTALRAVERRGDLLMLVTTPGTSRSLDETVQLGAHPHVYLNVVLINPGATEGEPQSVPLDLLHALKRERIRFSVTALLSEASGATAESVEAWSAEALGRKPRFAAIRSGMAEGPGAYFPEKNSSGRMLTRWRDADEFFSRIKRCTCLHGRVQLNSDGSLQPCQGVSVNFGILQHGGLAEGLRNEAVYDWWERDKNSSTKCGRCVVRYACMECAAVVFGDSQKRFCSFDPDGEMRAAEYPWQHDGFVYRIMRIRQEGEVLCQRV